jgi:hypothetical protein
MSKKKKSWQLPDQSSDLASNTPATAVRLVLCIWSSPSIYVHKKKRKKEKLRDPGLDPGWIRNQRNRELRGHELADDIIQEKGCCCCCRDTSPTSCRSYRSDHWMKESQIIVII